MATEEMKQKSKKTEQKQSPEVKDLPPPQQHKSLPPLPLPHKVCISLGLYVFEYSKPIIYSVSKMSNPLIFSLITFELLFIFVLADMQLESFHSLRRLQKKSEKNPYQH